MASRLDRGKTLPEIVRQYRVTEDFLNRCEWLGLLRVQRQGARRALERREEERLRIILKGLKLGFTLREMKMLFDASASPDPPAV